jgi:hypothetical protein
MCPASMEDFLRMLSPRHDILGRVSKRNPMVGALRRTVLEVVGWSLVVVGIALLVLPGPGLLTVFAGILVLSRQYDWARRQLLPIKVRAFAAAREGVRTWPRILSSAFAGLWVMGSGFLFIYPPAVPGWFPLDEQWWFPGGVVAGVSIVVSGVVGLGLLLYSIRRFRYPVSPGVGPDIPAKGTQDA